MRPPATACSGSLPVTIAYLADPPHRCCSPACSGSLLVTIAYLAVNLFFRLKSPNYMYFHEY